MITKEIKQICSEARAYFLLRAPASESIEFSFFYKSSLVLLVKMLEHNENNPRFSNVEGIKARAMIVSIEGLLEAFKGGKSRKASTVFGPSEIFRFTASQSRHFFQYEKDAILKESIKSAELNTKSSLVLKAS